MDKLHSVCLGCMADSENDATSRRMSRLIELLEARASDRGNYERASKRLREAREIFHEEVASQLEPLFNEHISKLPHATLAEKQALTRWANAELRGHGLAIMCRKSRLAGVLHADRGNNHEIGRFQIQLLDGDLGRKRTTSSVEVPSLSLTAYPYAHPIAPGRGSGWRGISRQGLMKDPPKSR